MPRVGCCWGLVRVGIRVTGEFVKGGGFDLGKSDGSAAVLITVVGGGDLVMGGGGDWPRLVGLARWCGDEAWMLSTIGAAGWIESAGFDG